MTIRSRSLYLAVAGAAVALSAGCAKSGKVSGKVTQADGSPLPGGVITFVPEDTSRNPAAATIKEDGTYEAADVPTGKCKIMIDNRMAGQALTPIGVSGGYGTDNKAVPVDPDAKEKGSKKGGPIGVGMKGGKGAKDVTAPPAANKSQNAAEVMESARKAAGAPTVGATVNVPGTPVKINSKYYTAESSGLSFDVAGGSNTYDVKLN